MTERPGREVLESAVLRHGHIAELSALIESGQKPPYEKFVQFMQGDIDPPIDEEATVRTIEEKMQRGEYKKEDVDIIICSPALRARQTANALKRVVGEDVPTHPSKYLREIRVPMDDVTPEFYERAKDIVEVRQQFMASLLDGKKVDEDIVDAYRRAERFLVYFHRIRERTNKHPLFVSHGIFSRFLNLAIDHHGETLSDKDVRLLVQGEFHNTQRPGTLEGIRLSSTKTGVKILGVT